jgi:hypothetical protein
MKFTEKEKKYLITEIENYIKIISKEGINENDKYYQKYKSIIDKINLNEPILNNYKSILRGIVREKYNEVENKKEIYYNKSDLEILNLSENEIIEIEYITEIEVLFNKFLQKDKKENLLGDYLKPYYELKKLPFNESYYSLSGDKIYKIGIPVDKKYLIKFKLSSDDKIFPFDKFEILRQKENFKFKSTNKEIVNLLDEYEKNNTLTQRMIFVKNLLNLK